MNYEMIISFAWGVLVGVVISVGSILYDAGDGQIVFFGHNYKAEIKGD